MHANHFWLRVHQLAEAFEERGSADDQRVRQVINELTAMPPSLQEKSLAYAARLSRLLTTVAAAPSRQF